MVSLSCLHAGAWRLNLVWLHHPLCHVSFDDWSLSLVKLRRILTNLNDVMSHLSYCTGLFKITYSLWIVALNKMQNEPQRDLPWGFCNSHCRSPRIPEASGRKWEEKAAETVHWTCSEFICCIVLTAFISMLHRYGNREIRWKLNRHINTEKLQTLYMYNYIIISKQYCILGTPLFYLLFFR